MFWDYRVFGVIVNLNRLNLDYFLTKSAKSQRTPVMNFEGCGGGGLNHLPVVGIACRKVIRRNVLTRDVFPTEAENFVALLVSCIFEVFGHKSNENAI
jgi:hypothetical protein